MTKEMEKLHEGLRIGLGLMDIQKDSKIAIALMLKSEKQMLTMLDWIKKHHKENPTEDLVIEIAKEIVAQVK